MKEPSPPVVMMVVLLGCGRSGPVTVEPAADATATVTAPAQTCGSSVQAAEGLRIERIDGPEGCLTAVRIDPRRFALRVLTARAGGSARTAPGWVEEHGLTGAINASMYMPDERSIGLLVSGDVVNNGRDNTKLGGFLAFDPVDAADPPVVMTARQCEGFDLAALRARYRSVVQNYRMLDCDGAPIVWKDEKVVSAAAIGLDADGQVVFLHSRAPYRLTAFNELLARPELKLRAALYVEGGPEASLYVKAGEHVVREMGSFEPGSQKAKIAGSKRIFWPIPNVIGFELR